MKRKTTAALAVAGASAVVVAIAAAACIPDLPADPSTPPPPGCGDGYVDLDAGEQCDPGTGVPAGTGGCTATCRVQCSGLLWSANDHCYELAPQTAGSLFEAAQHCGDLGDNAHVVTFASDDEFDTVAGYVSGVDAGPFWVGIDNRVSVAPFEPGWSPNCPGCYAHAVDTTAPLPRLDASAPDGAPLAEGCVRAFSDTRVQSWQQVPCSGAPRIRVVCEREPVGRQSRPCDAGICVDLTLTHAAKRYVYVPSPATADEADPACTAMGGRLVVLRSQDEREQLWLQLSRLDAVPPAVWIGLSLSDAGAADDGGPGDEAGAEDGAPSWVWGDGVPASVYPSEWAVAQPSSSPSSHVRAFLLHQGAPQTLDDTLARNDQPSLTSLPYVCEVPVASP